MIMAKPAIIVGVAPFSRVSWTRASWSTRPSISLIIGGGSFLVDGWARAAFWGAGKRCRADGSIGNDDKGMFSTEDCDGKTDLA